MSNVTCSGTESQLADCRHDGAPVQGCFHSKDAGVRCQSKYHVVDFLLCHTPYSTTLIIAKLQPNSAYSCSTAAMTESVHGNWSLH